MPDLHGMLRPILYANHIHIHNLFAIIIFVGLQLSCGAWKFTLLYFVTLEIVKGVNERVMNL